MKELKKMQKLNVQKAAANEQ